MIEVFTIGYSGFQLLSFKDVLIKNNIKAVIDVRSSPYSKTYPEYNKENLKNFLYNYSIYYVFLGEECGARQPDPKCYINGKIDFDLVSNNHTFQNGISRIESGAEKYPVALMCAEKDPVTCHRTILICKNLKKNINIKIKHIIDMHTIQTHEQIENRLLKMHGLDQHSFIYTENERLNIAYKKQENRIAYKKENEETEEDYE
ncbi:MAG: DUF488 family protein [Halodesulfovibrio sp.]